MGIKLGVVFWEFGHYFVLGHFELHEGRTTVFWVTCARVALVCQLSLVVEEGLPRDTLGVCSSEPINIS